MKIQTALILTVLGASLLSACGREPGATAAGAGAGPREIRVAAIENGAKMGFEPSRITVKPGERIRFAVENRGTQDHEFEGEEGGLEEIVVPPGKTRTVEWTAPRTPGEIEFVCDLPGHKEAGMVGTIVVAE
ncbi:cupredoxin domain-containing protein [Caldinitratiruptor microaerophilus]|uniref:EfeO-type cupredoxin-like domain-containing protein n=1 Tax=Caldinitratiruptor microaerophilus TaxID=671077 RepID=A0AA35CHW6_9FIRM|nr:cupredoxin domain-containing protein [Caldinitratiruptor microaerophilus]BDG59227.1 hypothetical protein caldi_03170 [Caldinitratiruptor microaerophilus]